MLNDREPKAWFSFFFCYQQLSSLCLVFILTSQGLSFMLNCYLIPGYHSFSIIPQCFCNIFTATVQGFQLVIHYSDILIQNTNIQELRKAWRWLSHWCHVAAASHPAWNRRPTRPSVYTYRRCDIDGWHWFIAVAWLICLSGRHTRGGKPLWLSWAFNISHLVGACQYRLTSGVCVVAGNWHACSPLHVLTESLIYHLSVKGGLSFSHGMPSTQMPLRALISCRGEYLASSHWIFIFYFFAPLDFFITAVLLIVKVCSKSATVRGCVSITFDTFTSLSHKKRTKCHFKVR